jgi:ParB-like chromosome segregation protein Spo0J
MKIFEITANLAKQYDPETDNSEIGTTVKSQRGERTGKVVILPMNQIRSRFEGDDKADPEWTDARANIEKIKKQIKRDISQLPPILVRRLPRENTYQVLDGHHRYFAFREMNVKHIPAIILSAAQITGDKYKE